MRLGEFFGVRRPLMSTRIPKQMNKHQLNSDDFIKEKLMREIEESKKEVDAALLDVRGQTAVIRRAYLNEKLKMTIILSGDEVAGVMSYGIIIPEEKKGLHYKYQRAGVMSYGIIIPEEKKRTTL
ncbi:hypothetical protein DICVIV_06581 [Dictyocaulus viviparus]|uniref:Uncharacterized protein n=1 Tax=Dictyocaulus viviparus TaxID=29172 RepID=A0A0D8XU44_DICVI|nr:hypothetical protein DICVIV_06581 [Dictyocaulus viviparus]